MTTVIEIAIVVAFVLFIAGVVTWIWWSKPRPMDPRKRWGGRE